MRGRERKQHALFSLLSPEKRVPADHPLRPIKKMVEEALEGMEGKMEEMYSPMGRASIPPERLLKSMLLIALYSIRSERLFCEELNYNLLYRWFLNMSMDEPSFHASTFSKNRARFLEHDVAREVFARVVAQARGAGLMSQEHFSVDGSLIEAWASLKSFRPRDEKRDEQDPPEDPKNPMVNFRGEKRGNATHASTTDPEAKLARKGDGKEAKLSYSMHGLMENRNGLLVELRVDSANGIAERYNAIAMLEGSIPGTRRITVAADKGYDDATFVEACRMRNVTPHVAQNLGRRGGSAIDGRTTQTPGYKFSQRVRKRIEEIFGWLKTVGGFRRTRFRGRARTQMAAYMAGAAYNLTRIERLGAAGP